MLTILGLTEHAPPVPDSLEAPDERLTGACSEALAIPEAQRLNGTAWMAFLDPLETRSRPALEAARRGNERARAAVQHAIQQWFQGVGFRRDVFRGGERRRPHMSASCL